MKNTDLASWKDTAEIVNKMVLTAAVVLGGIWTWWTFSGELKRENARAQLEKMDHELVASKRFAIEIDLQAKPFVKSNQDPQVEVEVVFKNKGLRDAEIPLKPKSLRITPITTHDLPAQPSLATEHSVSPTPLLTDVEGKLAKVKSFKLPSGTEAHLLYIGQVSAPGLYLLEFSTPSNGFGETALQEAELSASKIIDIPSPVVTPGGAKPPASYSRKKIGD